MREKSNNNIIDSLQVLVSSGSLLYPWKAMELILRKQERAGFEGLNTELPKLPVLFLLGASLGCSSPRAPLDRWEPAKIFHPCQIWVLPAPIPNLDVGDVIPRQLSPRCLQPSPDFGPRHRSERSRKEPREVQARSKQRDLVPN